jgi:hypothetical protein
MMLKSKSLNELDHTLIQEVLSVNNTGVPFDIGSLIAIKHKDDLNWQL